jgi:hypothetical protein
MTDYQPRADTVKCLYILISYFISIQLPTLFFGNSFEMEIFYKKKHNPLIISHLY